jgi:hypothetical protein
MPSLNLLQGSALMNAIAKETNADNFTITSKKDIAGNTVYDIVYTGVGNKTQTFKVSIDSTGNNAVLYADASAFVTDLKNGDPSPSGVLSFSKNAEGKWFPNSFQDYFPDAFDKGLKKAKQGQITSDLPHDADQPKKITFIDNSIKPVTTTTSITQGNNDLSSSTLSKVEQEVISLVKYFAEIISSLKDNNSFITPDHSGSNNC